MFRLLTLIGGALCVGLLSAGSAFAQWPDKPIRIINPFPAGGGTDTFARPLAAVLTKQLGQQVIIENQGGAGGTLGAGNAARATPDGYTFLMGAIHHTIAPSVYQKLAYDIEKDFMPITVAAFVPNVVVVHPKHPFKNMKDLTEFAKANPGKLNFATPGAGASQHLAAELYKANQKVDLVHVPYKGMGPAMQDLLAGHVDLVFDGMGASAAQVKAGKIVPLGLMAAKRHPQFPDIPTLAEQGMPGMEVTTWYALWAIKGTPQPIVDRMYKEVIKAFEDPVCKTAWQNAAADFGGMPPAEFAKFIRSEIERWGKVAKAANVRVDN